MRTLLTVSLQVLFVASTWAQITITSADMSTALAVGSVLIDHNDTLTTSVSIGTPGSTANTWNFSALATHQLDTLTSVTPSGTPYISWFPGATHTLRSRQTLQGVTGIAYQYLQLGANLLNRGNGGSGQTPLGTAVLKTTYTPSQVFYQLPMTLGTSWTTAYVESLVVTIGIIPFLTQITNYTISNTVDAFGSMTLPGTFGSHPALRIRVDTRYTGSGGNGRTIGYQFIASNSAAVEVVAADTLQPSSGTIQLDPNSTSWNGAVATDIGPVAEVPERFELMQNYPNPFNPSTRIGFRIADFGFVSLKAFDLLGREVATLVNEEMEPGSYIVRWDAEGLASGMYVYRLQAGNFTATRKMVLVR